MSQASNPFVPDDLITTSKAGQLLRTHSSTVVRWVLSGKLRGWRIQGRYRVSESDVRAMMRPVRADVPERARTRGEMEAASEAAIERMRQRGVRV